MAERSAVQRRAVIIGVPRPAAVAVRTAAPAAAGTRVAILVAMLVAAALGLRLAYVWRCNLAYDEYQHMHAAYLVSRGQMPFVDFFEHHTPLFYYLAAALIPMHAPSFDTLIQARYLSLAFHVLSLLLATLWVRALVGRAEALVVAALLIGNFCFCMWGTRTYLDTYAAPLLIAAAWSLPTRRHRGHALLSGMCFGLAMIVTQKALMAALAPAAVFLGRVPEAFADSSQRRRWLRDVAACVAGSALAAVLLLLLLRPAGVMGMIHDAIVLNLHWKARHFPTRELTILFASDGFTYLTAMAGVGIGLAELVRRRLVIADADVPWLFLLALGVGLFIMPVVAEEYFILMLPFAAITGGLTLVRWWRRYRPPRFADGLVVPALDRWEWAVVGLFVGASVADVIGLRFGSSSRLSLVAFILVPVLWGVLGIAALRARCHGRSAEAPLWLAVVLVLPVVQQADWLPRHANDEERARVEYIMSVTGANDPVFDGRSGYGVFRPHAYTYWFLHDEMQLMLSDAQKGPDIIRALEQQQVPIVIVDDFTKMLPVAVLEYIGAHYVDTPFPDIKRRRPSVATNKGADS